MRGASNCSDPIWAFGAEAAVHALRLLIGGVFDRLPDLIVVLGHLGELLPFAIRRLEQRMSRLPSVSLARPASQYLRENSI